MAECFLGGLTRFAILFTLNFMQQFAQPLAGPVQLRLRDAFRTSQQVRDLVMLVSLDIVHHKYSARASRQLRDAAAEIYSINRPLQLQVRSSDIEARRGAFTVPSGTLFHRDCR